MAKVLMRVAATVGVVSLWTVGLMADQAPQQTAGPTFARDVAPILYTHCTTCHRAGEIAPMSLVTYEEARPWARAIRAQVAEGNMPPWHADPSHGTFSNDRRLTAQEKDTILRWVQAGAPEGDAKDLPPRPTYTEGWTIGTPDAIVSMREPYVLPAEGEIEYQYLEVPTNFSEDRWVQAMEIRAGERSVVHHVLVFCRPPTPFTRETVFKPLIAPVPPTPQQIARSRNRPGSSMRRGNLIATTAPGMNATVFEPGSAMLIRAGSILTFQVHYTTNGKPTTDRTSIGFVFAKQPPAIEIRATAFVNGRFVIPPGAANHPVDSGIEMLEDITIYSIFPHTHLRGKSWEYRLEYPDGRSEIVLAVPTYDFNWQTDYVFATPLKAPKGSLLKAVSRYDNSKANKANPDPTAEVKWGDQTWEEMAYTGVNYSIDRLRGTTTAGAGPQPR